MIDDQVFREMESAVRSYCRDFPAVFTRAVGHQIYAEDGRAYIDFFSGAGALNYGHNNRAIKRAVLSYLQDDGILHALDLHTTAKRCFLETFRSVILEPRRLSYRVQFVGPTGTNAVEAALKLARKVTRRTGIVAFTNGYHGMSLGALAATARAGSRAAAGVPLGNVRHMPYEGYLGELDTIETLEQALTDPGSGLDLPAGIIVETVQGEGGLYAASVGWLRRLAALARRHDIVLIVDDVQAGCGRTGDFFSFEEADIVPDIVCLSKSIGGLGLPMAITLIRPDLDRWEPGEHNGTFRGNNLAFVAATAALDYWTDPSFAASVRRKSEVMRGHLARMIQRNYPVAASHRGRGMMQGIAFADAPVAGAVSREAFRRGLIAETCGSHGHVLKLMPPLTIDDDALVAGLEILAQAVAECSAARHKSDGLGGSPVASVGRLTEAGDVHGRP